MRQLRFPDDDCVGMIRRAALVFSLVLIVAIVVGYAARRSELAGQRDLQLTTSAEIASSRLSSIIDTIAIAAGSGNDLDATAKAVVDAHRDFGVCAIGDVAVACTGEGPQPPQDVVDHRQAARGLASELRRFPVVTVYDATMTIEIDGPQLSVVARGPASISATRSDVSAMVTTFLPVDTLAGGFAVEGGVRQTATVVDAAPNVYVVASGDDSVRLPAEEQQFYVIIFALAVVLLVLAGVTLVVEQRNLLERASFDPLTKLPNRSEFERCGAEAIAATERTGSPLCLLLFDLNGFKPVNDNHGHQAGDEILKIVASRLRKAVRDGDTVARWGGDEFVVMMPGIGSEEMGTRRARQLADAVGGRTRIEGIDEALRIKVSVGVAIWPDHGADLESLVSAADSAMYQAKRDGIVCRVASGGGPGAIQVASTV